MCMHLSVQLCACFGDLATIVHLYSREAQYLVMLVPPLYLYFCFSEIIIAFTGLVLLIELFMLNLDPPLPLLRPCLGSTLR